MSTNPEKKIELKIKSKLEQKKKKKTLDDGFKKNKVVNEVLDKIKKIGDIQKEIIYG